MDGEVTGGVGLLPDKEAGSPKGQQGLNQSPTPATEGDGGGSSSGLNLSETSALGPLQRVGSQAGVLGEDLVGEETHHPPRTWLGDTGLTESTEIQPGKCNSLPATEPQVAENLTPEPKAKEVEVEEEEAFDSGSEPVVSQPGKGGGRQEREEEAQS